MNDMLIVIALATLGLAASALWFTVWAERELAIDALTQEGGTPLAYVLIEAAPGHADGVAAAITQLPWAAQTHVVDGPFDVIVRVAPGSQDPCAGLAELEGIRRALPCHAAPAPARDVPPDLGRLREPIAEPRPA